MREGHEFHLCPAPAGPSPSPSPHFHPFQRRATIAAAERRPPSHPQPLSLVDELRFRASKLSAAPSSPLPRSIPSISSFIPNRALRTCPCVPDKSGSSVVAFLQGLRRSTLTGHRTAPPHRWQPLSGPPLPRRLPRRSSTGPQEALGANTDVFREREHPPVVSEAPLAPPLNADASPKTTRKVSLL